MNMQRSLIALTGVNLVLLSGLLAAHAWPAAAQGSPGLLRGTGLEIVDAQGRVRASISVLPPDAAGAAAGDTVLLRLIDGAGQPSVKIATSDVAAGLSFTGGDDLSYVVLQADGAHPQLKLSVQGGGERLVQP